MRRRVPGERHFDRCTSQSRIQWEKTAAATRAAIRRRAAFSLTDPRANAAAALTDTSRIVSLRLAFFLGGDVNAGEDAVGYSLAAWMILIMAVAMALYWVLRRRAERWQS